MEVYEFSISGGGDYEISGKSPVKINIRNYKIKEGDDYIKFSYPFLLGKDIKPVTFDFSEHYKIGFYVVYE